MKPTLRETIAETVLAGDEVTKRPSDNMGYLLGAVGAMLFSLKAIFVKLAYLSTAELEANQLDSITLLALRFGFSAPIFLGIFIWVMRKREETIPFRYVVQAILLGMVGYHACAYLDFVGLKYITAQLERLILFTYPMFVVIIGTLFFGGRISKSGIGAIALGYSGIGLIFLRGEIAIGSNVPLGSALVLATAIIFALFQLLAKPVIDKIGSRPFTCLAMLAATAAVLTHFFTVNIPQGTVDHILQLPLRIYIIGAAIALISTILPSFLVNMAIGKIGSQSVAVLGLFGPLATIIAAVLILGEPFGWVDAAGTALTLSGVFLYMWVERRQRPN